MIGKRKLITILIFVLLSFLLPACGKTEEPAVSMESIRENVGMEKAVLYINKPVEIDSDDQYEWISSDKTIAYVDNNKLIGVSEGLVTIRKIEAKSGKTIEEIEYVVTTFNDGKQVDKVYEIGREGFNDKEDAIDYQGSVDPEYLQLHINTIQDAVAYFQESGFYYYTDSPILTSGETDWLWTLSGEAVLWEKRGGISEVANAAAYLLQDDFEDWGFVIEFGYYGYVYNWFYEDGRYYFMDFYSVVRSKELGRTDAFFKPSSCMTDNTIELIVKEKLDRYNTFAAIMVSAMGHTDQPAIRYSYLHDSTAIDREKSVLALEECVYDNMKIVYRNDDYDFEFVSIPKEDMPQGVPLYGKP